MIDYSIYFKQQLPNDGDWSEFGKWDYFISAFTTSDRCRYVYDKVPSQNKIWLEFPHFQFSADILPREDRFSHESINEQEFISAFWDTVRDDILGKNICIDITAFLRPHLLFLIRWLKAQGINRFDAIYSEPRQYSNREQTEFSNEIVDSVRQVAGYEGVHTTDSSSDVLIMGVGYQDHLISEVAKDKAKAKKLQLFGFPPLRADMYQENVFKVHLARESLDAGKVNEEVHSILAPANDPFITAAALQEAVNNLKARDELTNLYLCPLSTKAQVLGFGIYYLTECINEPVSMIFPFETVYHQRTSTGIERIWIYSVELPCID